MTPRWIEYTEYRTGANDPNGATDVYNRPNRDIWENFTAEHDKDGAHKSDLLTTPGVWSVNYGTYTGNAADDRDIALADSGLTIHFIRVWSAAAAYTFFRTADIVGDVTLSTEGMSYANYIQDISTAGQFTVGTALNSNNVIYHYLVLGVS